MSASIDKLLGTFYEAASGNTELLDTVITDDWDDIPRGPGQGPGRAGARVLIEGLNKVFSDLRFVVEEIIDARGDDGNGMVGVRARMHGVHTGELFGIAATGRESEVRTHDFHEIVDGRAALKENVRWATHVSKRDPLWPRSSDGGCSRPGQEREMVQKRQFTQLACDLHRQRLAHAAQQRPGRHLLALHRATRRVGPDSARGIS